MKLKEILKICYGKDQKNVEVDSSEIPILGTGGIIGYTSKYLYDKESVLIPRKGTISKVFYIDRPFWTIDTLFYTKIKTSVILPKYLYYFLLLMDLNKFSEGSAVPSITRKSLYEINVNVPNFKTQQHIVNTIGSVDDLIEKKQEIILKIKEYRRIKFMKYASLSNLKEDILEHIELENGAQPPKEQHVYELMPGYVRFIQNRDYSSDAHLTYIPISKRNHLCSISDIMMDKYGDAGAIRHGIAGAFNVALLKIIPKNFYEIEYIRDFLSQKKIKDLLYLSSQASTRPSLNEKTFIGIKMPLLSKDILLKYQESMENILNIELKLKNEIEKLKQIKQHLLNKYF